MNLSKYVDEKLRIFEDFLVVPTAEEYLLLRNCKNEIQVDNLCRAILRKALED